MNRLMAVMQLCDANTGKKHVAGFVLSSTCLPRSDIKRAITDFEGVGYACQESHGVQGTRRREIAGVMVCIDTRQLRFLRVGSLQRYRRVVRRGRVMRVRLGVVGAADTSTDFNVLAGYMPPRGAGARGYAEPAMNAYVSSVWGSLASEALQLGRRGRLMLAGDLNAELPESLRRADRVARPADGSFAQLRELSRMDRAHDVRDWTYTGVYRGRDVYSVIDHVFVSAAMLAEVRNAHVADGVEVGEKRHRALWLTLAVPVTVAHSTEGGERRKPAVRMCTWAAGAKRAQYDACKATYYHTCAAAVQRSLDRLEQASRERGEATTVAARIVAIQEGTARAMADALAKHDMKASGSTGGAVTPTKKNGWQMHRREHALFVMHVLAARRRDMGRDLSDMPTILQEWDRLFIRPAKRLKAGLPATYAMLDSRSELAGRLRKVYGSALRHQIIGAGGQRCAAQRDVDELLCQARVRMAGDGPAGDRSQGSSACRPSEAVNHYEVLQVSYDVSAEDATRAYRRLSLRWHPDKCAEPGAQAEFRILRDALDTLIDPARRAQHDVALGLTATASHGCYCDQEHTRLSRAGLRLAVRRWHLENNAIDDVWGELKARRDEALERDHTSYYARRMREAARQRRTESVAYGLVYTHKREAANRGGPLSPAAAGKLAAVSVQRAGREEMEFLPSRVRDAVRAVMVSQGGPKPYSTAGSMELVTWARQHDGMPEQTEVRSEGDSDWRERVFGTHNFQRALQRMRPTGQAAGYDGWLGALLRWAPFSVQEQYRLQVVEANADLAAEGNMPEDWPVNVVTHVPKPGKSVTKVDKMRDLWNCPHGWKLSTHCMRFEYDRVNRLVQPGANRGFTAFADAGEAAMTAGLHSEVANTLCETMGRLFVDFVGFFMGVMRGLLYFLEGEFGVEPGVTAGVKAVHDQMVGRADTAYGLSDAWEVTRGTGQGCVLGPCRATMQLIVTLVAISRFGGAYCFEVPAGARPACVMQAWFADDVNTQASNAQGVQLSVDGAYIGAFVTGNVMGVAGKDDASKTGYQLEQCTA